MNKIDDFLNNDFTEDAIPFDKLKYIFNEISDTEKNEINRFLTESPENKIITFEELKNVFKTPIQRSEQKEISAPDSNPEPSSVPEIIEEKPAPPIPIEDTYREPFNRYAAKKQAVFRVSDILIFFSVLIICASSFFWFVTPKIQIGGTTYLGKTLNLYEFIYGNDNSLYKQILSSVNNIDADLSGVASVLKILRLSFYAAPTVIVSIAIIINAISAIVGFLKKDSKLLRATAVNSITNKLFAYVCFAFFGNISGGTGQDAYYTGYSIGTGMTISILFTIALLTVVLISEYFKNKAELTETDRNSWQKYFWMGIFNILIITVVINVKLYSVFVYVIESVLTSIVSLIQNFSFETLIFPVLNLIVFYACLNIYRRSVRCFSLSFNCLLKDDYKQSLNLKRKKTFKKSLFNFYYVIITSLLSVISVFVLNKTKYGLGWQGNIYTELVIIFALSLIGQSVMSFLNRKAKNH